MKISGLLAGQYVLKARVLEANMLEVAEARQVRAMPTLCVAYTNGSFPR